VGVTHVVRLMLWYNISTNQGENMSATFEDIRHDGGTHRVEVKIEGDQCVIRFGASFTLRVNEANLNTLREMIHDAARDMAIKTSLDLDLTQCSEV
jgi:hypothetical protein